MQLDLLRRLITEFESDVMADGFDGYFFNTEDDPNDVLTALETVGASETATILRRAIARFPHGNPPRSQSERRDALVRISPDGSAFAVEDADFFAYPDDLQALIRRYIREGDVSGN